MKRCIVRRNTFSPGLKPMNDMVGGVYTYTDISHPHLSVVDTDGRSYWFYLRDVEIIEGDEDETI